MALRALTILLLAALLAAKAHAAVLRVGPNEAIQHIADAARQAKAGDTVEILPGTYRGDVAVWSQTALTIRGSSDRPVLMADGQSAEQKAIWVIRGGDIRIENIEFRGARVTDGNGAGIRHETGRLHIHRCAFFDNQNGILTSGAADAELIIEDSIFAQAPRQQAPLPHLLYVGAIRSVSITGSRFHGGYRGHLIKSRARLSDIRYNLIHDGDEGEASYEIDLPNGGLAWLVGNVISQSATTQNPVVVSYGAEGGAWPDSALYLSHNTLVSRRIGTWFLRVWLDRLPAGMPIHAVNNLTAGIGLFTIAAPGRFEGNFAIPVSMLSRPDILDFTLAPNSILRGRAQAPDEAFEPKLIPQAEFALPVGTRPLIRPARWAPGAFQTSGYPLEAAAALKSAPIEPIRAPSGRPVIPQENE